MSDLEAWKRNPPSIVTSDSPAAEQDRIADLFGYPPESNPQTRLIDAFHERTGRCLGGVHLTCARIEQRHREGNHSECLPVEDGALQTEPHSYEKRQALREMASSQPGQDGQPLPWDLQAHLAARHDQRDETYPAHLLNGLHRQLHRDGARHDLADLSTAEHPFVETFDLETQEGRIEALGHASKMRAQAISDLREADRLIERCWSAAEAALSRHRSDWETT